jgi:HlyD family secretion protein
MKYKRPPMPALILIGLVIILGAYFIISQVLNGSNKTITASGTIEATQVDIAPEISGKVDQVLVDEGQSVLANDPVLRLDPNVLQQQRKVAAANLDYAEAASMTAQNALEIAKSQYQVTLQAALAQDKKVRLSDWYSEDQSQFDQPNWYFTREEQAQAAQLQVDATSKALEEAKTKLAEVTNSLDKADFLAAEKRLVNARLDYKISDAVNTRAQNSNSADVPTTRYNQRNCAKDKGYHFDTPDIMNQVEGCIADQNLTRTSQAQFDAAKAELTQSQQIYNGLLTSDAGREVLQARADVSVAQEKYYAALDQLRALQTGDQSPAVSAAQGSVDQAQAAYDQSLEAVKQAQANLDLLDAQVAKLTVSAPMDGVILSRDVEPGEFVQPGAVALTMADLSGITITVYIPEDRYGNIHLGQAAGVSVDSFPNETFTASVIYISDQAEFTPRNVQTVEGRSSTVFAIKLKVEDPKGKLKIGMPADVVFK